VKKIGRKNVNFNNLFAGIIKCPYCQGPLSIDTNQYRKHKVKVYKYLYCNSNAIGRNCTSRRVRYTPFETAFLHHITEFDIEELFNEKDNSELLKLEEKFNSINTQINNVDTEIESLLSLSSHSSSTDAVKKIFNEKLNSLAELKFELEDKGNKINSNINSLKMNKTDSVQIQQSISSTIDKLKNLEAQEIYLARAKLAQIIKNVVDKVYVYTAGWPSGSHKKGENFLFQVKFNNGSHRVVEFNYNKPEKYKICLFKASHLNKDLI